jgi:hypothetical protein
MQYHCVCIKKIGLVEYVLFCLKGIAWQKYKHNTFIKHV